MENTHFYRLIQKCRKSFLFWTLHHRNDDESTNISKYCMCKKRPASKHSVKLKGGRQLLIQHVHAQPPLPETFNPCHCSSLGGHNVLVSAGWPCMSDINPMSPGAGGRPPPAEERVILHSDLRAWSSPALTIQIWQPWFAPTAARPLFLLLFSGENNDINIL